MKFALATANPGKIKEMLNILSGMGFELVTRDQLGIDFHVEETGLTFMENALLKAQAICDATGLPAIADDSGLVVMALNGEPGVFSSSYGGVDLSDEQRCKYLLEKMRDKEQNKAKFVCTIVCAFPSGEYLSAEGECDGEITFEPRGTNGFGYDPVFLVDGVGKTMAQLSPSEKNAVSHRGKALIKFAALLQERGGGTK